MRYTVHMLLFIIILASPAITYGAWTTDLGITDPEVYWAGTTNDAGRTLGLFCSVDDNSCLWLLSLHQICTAGSEYHALLNTASGTAVTQLVCLTGKATAEGNYAYMFKDLKQIDEVIRDNTFLSIASATDSQDQGFLVTRFDLEGAKSVIPRMLQAFKAKPGAPNAKPRSTKDQRL